MQPHSAERAMDTKTDADCSSCSDISRTVQVVLALSTCIQLLMTHTRHLLFHSCDKVEVHSAQDITAVLLGDAMLGCALSDLVPCKSAEPSLVMTALRNVFVDPPCRNARWREAGTLEHLVGAACIAAHAPARLSALLVTLASRLHPASPVAMGFCIMSSLYCSSFMVCRRLCSLQAGST